jgi:hypothetical protein
MDTIKAMLALERMARAIAELEGEDGGRGKTEDRGRRTEDAEGRKATGEVDPTQPELRAAWRKRWTRHMVGVFERQRDVVLKRAKSIPDISILWDGVRWNAELTGDFRKLSAATALEFAHYVSEQLGAELDESEMEAYLAESSRIAAEQVNGTTQAQIEEALRAEDPLDALKGVFEVALSARAAEIAQSRTTTLANFGTMNAARQGGLRTKTWHVNSTNPRPSHARMGGATVGIRELFSNGMMWPGDPKGGADEVAGCTCSVTFGRETD